jgi:hypothetical protein
MEEDTEFHLRVRVYHCMQCMTVRTGIHENEVLRRFQ